jgi:hypothetical protein
MGRTSVDVVRGYITQFEGPKSELAFVAAADSKCADVVRTRRIMNVLAMCRQPGRCVEGEKNLPRPVN